MKKFIKNIIFTRTPLTGKYRYGDLFQIYPLNIEGAPNFEKTDHQPIIIEYWFEMDEAKKIEVFGSEDIDRTVATMTVQINKLIEYTSLLSAISNYRFFFYKKPSTFWSMPLTRKGDVNQLSSEWSASLYYYPNIANDLKIEGFSDPNFPNVLRLPQNRYYWDNPIEGHDKNINFPDTIDDILSKYFLLSAKESVVANSCIYLLAELI